MRYQLWAFAALFAFSAVGCATNPALPIDTAEPSLHVPQVALGEASMEGENLVMPLGLYTINLDASGMSASIEPKEVRSLADAGDTTYELCVSEFFPTPPVRIMHITLSADALRLEYQIQHPFAAPTDWTAPASASNRADLAISGRCIFFVDGEDAGTPLQSTAFFTEPGNPDSGVRMVDKFVLNCAGFTDPQGPLTYSFKCNAFPFLPLVDETNPECRTSSRTGAPISNGGSDTGNYSAAAGGWQRGNMGAVPSENGATGYSVLHQGQTASNFVDFSLEGLAALDAGGQGFSLDMAIVAHYNDPRGGDNAAAKKRNRLPSATGSIDDFFYDMPLGTCVVVDMDIDQPDWSLTASSNPLTCRVADWFSTSAAGQRGTIRVCVPGLLGSSSESYEFSAAAVVTGSGTPSDPWSITDDVPLPPGATPGTYKFCVQYQESDLSFLSHVVLDCDLAPATAVARNGYFQVLRYDATS